MYIKKKKYEVLMWRGNSSECEEGLTRLADLLSSRMSRLEAPGAARNSNAMIKMNLIEAEIRPK